MRQRAGMSSEDVQWFYARFKRCLFCGEHGSSREHVFALWISKLFSDAAPFTVKATHGRSKTGLKQIALYSRAACRHCNNGWMSELEQRARPLLTPAIPGQTVRWDAEEQLIVAAWAFKTALMLDRSSTSRHARRYRTSLISVDPVSHLADERR